MPLPLREAATAVAAELERRGSRGWLVGGAVRDLALGKAPGDADVATASVPDDLERWFAVTHRVGRAFGTLVVRAAGQDVQVTTFRSEGGYGDGRRPDRVSFGATIEEDARRRDFTCNALYLDPLTDELADPTGGLGDLERGVLRAVGDPRERFAEDGLRLLRLARFAGEHGLAVEPGTLEAARAERERVRAVSPERILAELVRVFERGSAPRALAVALDAGLLEPAVPGLPAPDGARLLRVFERLPEAPGAALGWAALLGDGDAAALAPLEALRPSRALVTAVAEVRAVAERLQAGLPPDGDEGARAVRLRLLGSAAWRDGRALALARAEACGSALPAVAELDRLAGALGPGELAPEPLLASSDLAALGVPRGKRWGELLARALELQLDGRLRARDEALAWLRSAVAGAQDGGNTRRKP